jgi:hypothetical protein
MSDNLKIEVGHGPVVGSAQQEVQSVINVKPALSNEPIQRFIKHFKNGKRLRNPMGVRTRTMNSPLEIRGHQYIRNIGKFKKGLVVPPDI